MLIIREEVREKLFEALNDVKETEAKMLKLLEEGFPETDV